MEIPVPEQLSPASCFNPSITNYPCTNIVCNFIYKFCDHSIDGRSGMDIFLNTKPFGEDNMLYLVFPNAFSVSDYCTSKQ